MQTSRWILTVLSVALVAGCAGGGSNANDAPATPRLTVTPTEWSVPAGGAPKQFTASLTGSSAAIAWSIETAGTTGTISATGLYTPPASLATGRDVVVKATAGTLVARATVHVGAGVGGVTLAVTPPTASVVAGSGSTVVLEAQTNSSETLGWSMAPALGTLDPVTGTSVAYTAPSSFVMWDTDVVVTATAGALSDATTITVQPTRLAVSGLASVRAGGDPVEFRVTTDVGGNAVAWSLEPPDVGSITGTGAAGTFTPVATSGSSTPFHVIATVGGATGYVSVTLLPPAIPVAVAGRVVDQHGLAYAGAKVVVGAQAITTGPDGAFSVSAVLPYDAAVITDDDRKVTLFRGVSATSPQLTVFRSTGGGHMAQVRGIVTDDGVASAFTNVFGPIGATTSNGDGTYALSTFWSGDVSTTLTIRALDVWWNPDTLHPLGYGGFGSRAVAVTDGGTVTGQDIALSPVASGHVTGTCDAEGALHGIYTIGFSLSAHFPDGTFFQIDDRLFSEFDPIFGAFDWVAPALPTGRVQVGLGGWGPAGQSSVAGAWVVPGQTGVDLVLPDVPLASAPADGATGVGFATPLTWTTANGGGRDGISIECDGFVSFQILGGGRSATIPDLTAHGVPAVTTCTWYPTWTSVTLEQHLQGPAAVDAIPLARTAAGGERSFTF